MRRSHHSAMSQSLENQGVPMPPLELPYDPATPCVNLPAPAEVQVPAVELRAAIEKRRSLRSYAPQPLTLEELSFLLWASQGVQRITQRPVTLRNVPSAGARHAFETFLLVNHVSGLAPGLYRYAALRHALLEVDLSPQVAERAVAACLNQGMVARAAVTFVWVAVLARMYWRYGERGYRYLHLDAGHACQNLYLAAEALDAGACAIAAFDDDLLNQVVGADGEELFAIYAAVVGKRPQG
jgi:SagB-type dehydrogenase family enzyme